MITNKYDEFYNIYIYTYLLHTLQITMNTSSSLSLSDDVASLAIYY